MMQNWKIFGRKWQTPNFKVLSRNFPGGTEENEETQSGQQVAGAEI
jgi:hypothetical protein